MMIVVVAFACFGQINRIRIAHFIAADISAIPNDFLDFCRTSGINYVLAHGNHIGASSGASDWRNPATHAVDGSYDMTWAKANTSLYSKLKDLFERADARGLKVIPCFNITSRWAEHWSATNANIQWNDGLVAGRCANVYIADPNGIDRSFSSYLGVVHEAFSDANLSYTNLDFIHIGHDETVDIDEVGGTGRIIFYQGHSNANEQVWLQNTVAANGGDWQAAYDQLMAEEVVRRVNAVNSVFTNTRTIIWAGAIPIWGQFFQKRY
jgi:hypothetical protein